MRINFYEMKWNIVKIFAHNNPLFGCNPHLWVQTTFMSLWFYSVAKNQLKKGCTHQTTYCSSFKLWDRSIDLMPFIIELK